MSDLGDTLTNAVGPRLPSHLYLHVPFCATKCGYCDFASVAGADEATADLVFRAMRTQLLDWERAGLDGVLETVYFGGGTPTLFAENVVELLGFIRDTFAVHAGAEITVEANPDSIDDATAALLAGAGVTRVSVGVQSFDDHDLRVLGRIHDASDATRACERVVRAGMSLALDLMCAIPGQTRTSWASTLERAGLTGAEHVSVYPLALEDGTALQVAVDTGLLSDPGPDVAAEMMVLAQSALSYHGFARYEIANYARTPDARSRHNSAYWTGRPYLGVGPGAHGMLDAGTARVVGMLEQAAPEVARVRYANAPEIEDWLLGRGFSVETLTIGEAAREDAMLGLRLTEGISDELARRAGVVGTLEALARDDLVRFDTARWTTTQRGWLLGNEVFGAVWLND